MVGYAQTVNAHEVNSGAAAERAFCSPTAVTQQSTPESRGPDDLNSLKRLNHFVVEKLADIEKLAKKCIN
ncbi:hypothetical protein MTO96_049983 [Rhipicephalus appendiculatus]